MHRGAAESYFSQVAQKIRFRQIIISVWTRFRSDEQRNSTKLENSSLSADVFIRSIQKQLLV